MISHGKNIKILAGNSHPALAMQIASALGLPRMAFQNERAAILRQKLCFPEGHDFMIAIAIGTPADDKEAHPVGENKISVVK